MIKHKGVLTQPCVGNNQRLSQATNTVYVCWICCCLLNLVHMVHLRCSCRGCERRKGSEGARAVARAGARAEKGETLGVCVASLTGFSRFNKPARINYTRLSWFVHCARADARVSETNQNAVPRFRLVVSLSIQFRAHFRIFACGASRFSKGTFAPPCFLVVIRHDFQILDSRFVQRIPKLYSLTSIKVDFLQVL